MNSKWKRTLATALCGAVLIGGVGARATVRAVASAKSSEVRQEPTVTASAENADGLVKDETVYVLAGADGSVEKIIVSDWIKNVIESGSISDRSELSDIENVKGDESYTLDGSTMKVWNAEGKDIYYQGSIDKELPVSLTVSYFLDGESISAESLAEKSGKVTIRFDYRSNLYETVEIDGTPETIYVPFAMLTGMLLDNDIFRNVEVSNGKLLNDGDRTIVAGLALPGLQSNLQLDAEKLEIPEYVEIRAEVKNFAMPNTVTLATNEVFNGLDSDALDSTDELTSSLGSLTEAMTQLLDGSSALYDGLCTLVEKSDTLVSGIDQLAEAAAALKNGAASLNSGAQTLANGAQTLANGLGELSGSSADLNNGALQVFTSLLGAANTQLAAAGLDVPTLTVSNYADVLNGVIASLDTESVAAQAQEAARQQITAAVTAQRSSIEAAVTQAVREQVSAQVTQAVRANVEQQVLASLGLTAEQYAAGVENGSIPAEQQTQITAAMEAQMASETAQAAIAANLEAQMQSDAVQSTIAEKTEAQIAQLIEENLNSPDVQAQITAALGQAQSGAAAVSELKGQLDAYSTFYNGLSRYTAGVDSAKSGADSLNAGAAALQQGVLELSSGMDAWYSGILTLKNGTPALVDGITALRDGAMKLSDGLSELNEKGVQKLVDAVDGDLAGLTARLEATADVSADYNSFSGISDQMEGHVKFIYRTEAIE